MPHGFFKYAISVCRHPGSSDDKGVYLEAGIASTLKTNNEMLLMRNIYTDSEEAEIVLRYMHLLNDTPLGDVDEARLWAAFQLGRKYQIDHGGAVEEE